MGDKANKEDGSTPHAVFHNTLREKKYVLVPDKEYPGVREDSFMKSAYKRYYGKEPPFTKAGWRKGGEQLPKIENRDTYMELVNKDEKNYDPKGEEFGAETEDYIFYDSNFFDVARVLSIPDHSKLGRNLLPDWRHPSDHFHIQADLVYTNNEAKKPELVVDHDIDTCQGCKSGEVKSVIDGKVKLLVHPRCRDTGKLEREGPSVSCAQLMSRRGKRITKEKDLPKDIKYNIFPIFGARPIESLAEDKIIKIGTDVICAYSAGGEGETLVAGEVGNVRMITKKGKKAKNGRVFVKWSGRDRNGKTLTKGEGWTKALIRGYKLTQRRRMAQREFSSRRDSPVMTRLLQEII